MTNVQKEDIHDLLKTFFNEKGLVRQHLDSYNEFIDHGLQEVVDEVAEIPIEVPENPYKVKLGQIWVIDPQSRITGPYATEVDGTKHEIYPMEARLRNLAYSAPIALEMTPVVDGREQDTELVYIGNIPVMLKSKLCFLSQLSKEELIAAGEDPDDPGGYFVVNGSERVIVAMEHATKDGKPKILHKCTLPLTGLGVVNLIITELAVIDVTPEGLLLREIAAGVTPDDVQKLTEPRLRIAPNLITMTV